MASGCTSPPAFASYDPTTSSWKTSPPCAPGASAGSSPTWPRSGMTSNGSAYPLPTSEPPTDATAPSSSPTGRTGKPRARLLPTPDTGTTPNGHGSRGGRPGNGHQSGSSLDAAARTLAAPGCPAPGSAATVAWGDYEPAIRPWEQILGCPAPAPAEPGPAGRPRRPRPARNPVHGRRRRQPVQVTARLATVRSQGTGPARRSVPRLPCGSSATASSPGGSRAALPDRVRRSPRLATHRGPNTWCKRVTPPITATRASAGIPAAPNQCSAMDTRHCCACADCL